MRKKTPKKKETKQEKRKQQTKKKTTNKKGVFMRVQFIETKSRKKAIEECPWACKIVKVVGGYRAFESWNDYYIWKGQK